MNISRRKFLKVSAAAVPAIVVGATLVPDAAAVRQLLDSMALASYPRGFKHQKVAQSLTVLSPGAFARSIQETRDRVAADVFNKAFGA